MNLISVLNNQLKNSFSLLLDSRCFICDTSLHNRLNNNNVLCYKCEQNLPLFRQQTENSCARCAMPIVKFIKYCIHCQNNELPFIEKTYSPFVYDFPINKLILELKHHPNNNIAKYLAEYIYNEIFQNKNDETQNINLNNFDEIIPMPLHFNRSAVRGFNQSILLAKALSKMIKIPVKLNLVKRIVNTDSNESASREQRFSKIKNAFWADDKAAGKSFILIDDVMTTGASMNELARALKNKNAKNCYSLIAARAVLN